MNKVEDSVIKYQISFERYKNGKANEIIELLDKANKNIAKSIKETDGVYTKARYKEIAKVLKDISADLKENVDKNIDIDGVIDYELRKERKLLELAKPYIKKVKGGEINFLYPSREQIKTSALFQPITTDGYGMTYQSYLDGIETGLFNTWDSAVRTGYLTGMSAKEITRNVLGSASKVGQLVEQGTMYTLRNSLYANTRTALQSFANETMQRVYAENEQYFGDGESDYKYEYLACLDSRTCMVCGNADGKLYKTLNDCPHVPQHRGCRCMIIPYFNIEGDTRASKTGQIDSNITFNEWLGNQDEKTQRDVLGETRFLIYQNDPSAIKTFIDNGKVISLDDLYRDVEVPDTVVREKETGAEKKATDVTKRRSEIKITKDMTPQEKEKAIQDWIIETGLKDKIEYRVITDLDNNVLCITKGVKGEVGYSDSAIERSVFRKHKENTLLSYHNHNIDSAPSYSDIEDCARAIQYKESIVFTKARHKYGIRRGKLTEHLFKGEETDKFFKKFEEEYEALCKKYQEELNKLEAEGMDKKMLYVKNILYSKKVCDIMKEKYGYEFIDYE